MKGESRTVERVLIAAVLIYFAVAAVGRTSENRRHDRQAGVCEASGLFAVREHGRDVVCVDGIRAP